MLTEANSRTSKVSVPVALVLRKKTVKGTYWSLPSWSLDSVLVGENIRSTNADGEKVSEDDESACYLWSGLRVVLFSDACERYWHALIGERPLVYVVLCEDGADGSIEPDLVTIDYDEATAHSETDGQVLTADIPQELYQLMESFVLQNYEPQEFKKRKRKKWVDGEVNDDSSDPWAEKNRFHRKGYHG